VVWIDLDVFQIRKIEFYERRGDLLKTLLINDYREYSGNIWRAHHFIMKNHQTGKSTELIYSEYRFKMGLTDNDFSKSSLRRIR